ncbi:MAG: RNA polymerase subunit sigma-70, partial [Clostridiales bacterium]|nr:RNA polymerase subunit sigma-70 [Clostridiales bacterium]
MEDEKIIELYWERDEAAIRETSKKYGAYCHSIAQNLLSVREDA